jgi:uncharacterized membrane protein YphA (DoxX/SURF4 family)
MTYGIGFHLSDGIFETISVETAVLYASIYLCFVLVGGGKFSLDDGIFGTDRK